MPVPGESVAMPLLFAGYTCHVSPFMDERSRVIDILTATGANVVDDIDSQVQFFITSDNLTDQPVQTGLALRNCVTIVKPEWVDKAVEEKKVPPWEEYFVGPEPILSGVVVCFSQIDDEDFNAMWAMVVMRGGCCVLDLDSTVTHLVVTSRRGEKYKAAARHRIIHIVTPEWLCDSALQGRRISEALYSLPTLANGSAHISPAKATDAGLLAELGTAPDHAYDMEQPDDKHSFANNIGDTDNSMPETQCANDMSEDDEVRPEEPRTVDAARPGNPAQVHGDVVPVGTAEGARRVDPELASTSRSSHASVGLEPGPGHSPAGAKSLPERRQTSPQTGLARTASGTETASLHSPQRTALPGKSTDASSLDTRTVAREEMPDRNTALRPSPPSQTRPAKSPYRSPSLARPLTEKSSPVRIVVDLSQEAPEGTVKKRDLVDLTADDSGGEHGHPAGGSQAAPAQSAARTRQATPVQTPSAIRVKTSAAPKLTPPMPRTSLPHPMMQTPAGSACSQGSKPTPQTPASGPATPSELLRSSTKPQVLSGCKFFLTRDEELVDARGQSIGTWDTVASNIRRHGGVVLPQYAPAVTHVLSVTSSPADVLSDARAQDKVIASLTWLDDVISSGELFPPTSLVHRVVPKHPVPGAEKLVICITNYINRERDNIKFMTIRMGAAYSGPLTRGRSTHLVAASPHGEKYKMACEWGVPVVSHLWLEEMFKRWELVPEAGFRTLVEHHMPLPAPLREEQRVKSLLSAAHVSEATSAAANEPCRSKSRSPIDVKSMATVRQSAQHVQPAPSVSPAGTGQPHVEPSISAPRKRELTSPVPVSSNHHKRARQDHATTTEESAPTSEATFPVLEPAVNRRPVPTPGSRGMRFVEEVERSSPKPAAAKKAHHPVSVLFSAIAKDRDVEHLKLIVVKLGGTVAIDHLQPFTHLVADKVARTIKFLSGMSLCRHIVTPDWLIKSAARGAWQDEARFVLKDVKAEEQYGFTLSKSLLRAGEGKLLGGAHVFVTPRALGNETAGLKEIILAAGGKVLYSRPTLGKLRDFSPLKRPVPAEVYFIVASADDRDMCQEYVDHGVVVFSPNLVLSGALKQELDYKANILFPEPS